MKKFNLLFILLSIGFVLNSCKKNEPKTTSYVVRMTDNPGNYDAVNIDLKAVEVIGNGGAVLLLNARPGIYNLLDLANGVEILIASADLPLTSVNQIRLILGSNNTIVVDNVSYPLSTPSAEQSGLKINVNHNLQPGVAFTVLIDFDANQSIVKEGNGKYKLKPVIRTIEFSTTGSIKGKIVPKGTLANVSATINSVTFSSIVDKEGRFNLKGLLPGIYTVTITPVLPFAPFTFYQVGVTIGSSTDIGTIQL